MARTADPYHHGNLRQALLVAAEAELIAQGVDSFTLRGCARRAGVSHAAPAHHFGNAQGLLAALAVEAFSRLADNMRREIAAAGSSARAPMLAAARGYLRFALTNPGLFQLMFRLQGATDADPAVRSAGQEAFNLAADTVGAFHGVVSAMDDPKVAPRVIELWALAHGLAELALANQFGPRADSLPQAEAILEQFVTKQKGRGPHGPRPFIHS